MRRLRELAGQVTDAVLDVGHAGLAQTRAGWAWFRRHGGFPIGTADCAPIPVVLLPGILERWIYMAPMGRFLASQGHPVHVVATLGWNISSLEDSVERCLQFFSDKDIHGAVLVAHSKGGLIGKSLLLDPRLGDGAVGLVAVATPFAGSTLGGPLQRLPFLQRSPLGLFTPTNLELGRLSEERDVNSRIVSLAPAWDQMIPGGSRLEGATNVLLEGRGHFRPVDDPAVWGQVHTHVHDVAELASGSGHAPS
ncbi:esterase/lipase family protein [Tessaracoccus antarcticus]|uniref:Alpha/beta hydrolase n=1 Tax=Tessaracoccus antarcticus TaxID=2479848 RepID=A0A3M0GBY5_9ACTN|nr:hypothetical protein [Tessaracoccus antarcticus]RMB61868.1 hypothetical protein EAX62_04500 [Tessaracoccus antarcticus]